MKIVFLDAETLGNVSLAPIERLGEFVVFERTAPGQAAERIKDAEIVITNKVRMTADLMSRASKLKLVCVAATGTDNVDSEAARSLGIEVKNVVGYSTDSVAQMVFVQLLNLVVRPQRYDNYVKSGRYAASNLFTEVSDLFPELAGKTMGIVGMGRIGQKVASIAAAFGMTVIYFPTSGIAHNTDYPSASLEELLSSSDVVSLHCPLNNTTRNLIGSAQLRLMKPSSYLINMARGGIVDWSSLVSALDAGIISGAAVDVFPQEPVSPPVMEHPERLLLSPHVAWTSREAISRLVEGIANNIAEFVKK